MSESGDPSTWAAELDALTALHTHAWSGVQVVKSWSDVVRYGPDGEVLLDTRGGASASPEALWSGPLRPHALENVGERDLVVVSVEPAPTS